MKPQTRCALVVGATGAVGSAVCRQLAGRGTPVVLAARSALTLQELAEKLPGPCRATWIACDLGAPHGAAGLAHAALGVAPISDLVLCAGSFEAVPIAELTDAAMQRTLAVHAVGPTLLVRELGSSLREHRGAVVAVSDLGVELPFPNHLAYLAAKGALDVAMRALAAELAPDVRVNVVRPGVATDPGHEHDGARAGRLAARSLLGRIGTPDEIAQVVVAMLDARWVSGRAWAVG